VKEGDTVTFGEMALNAETDKDIQDIPADQSGTVLKIIAQIGDNVECHQPLAIVGEPGENIDALLSQLNGSTNIQKQETVEANLETKTDKTKATTVEGRIPVSPLAKKMAKENGENNDKLIYKTIDFLTVRPKNTDRAL
ncbi:MAG: hypothetical protein EOM23_05950, partial [Candidatus Moranbacteria bacterium]|nr:hypothetical protein [Candidatus Moranbacteria bacterium]